MKNKNWEQCKYAMDILVDVNNFPEMLLFLAFLAISFYLLVVIVQDLRIVNNLRFPNSNEKADLIKVKLLLLGVVIFSILAYIVEIVGFKIYWCAIPVIYYFFSLMHITLFYIALWQSSLIWMQLLYLKDGNVNYLLTINRLFQKYPILETVISLANLVNFSLFIFEIGTFISGLLFMLNMVILFLFIVVSLLFIRTILSQKAIPNKSRRRVFACIIGLSLCIIIRMLWNIVRIIFKENFKFKDEKWGWFIYLIIYIPTVDLLPIYLLNAIYQPQQRSTSQHIQQSEYE